MDEGKNKKEHTALPNGFTLLPQWPVWMFFFVLTVSILLAALPQSFSGQLNESAALMLGMALQTAGFLLLPVVIVRGLYRQSLSALGLRKAAFFPVLKTGALWGVALFLLNQLLSMLAVALVPSAWQTEQGAIILLEKMQGQPWLFLLLCAYLLIFVPVAEEMLFRGFLFTPLRARFSRLAAVLISGLVFSLAHGNIVTLLPLFVGGCGFALLYDRYGSLYYSITAHTVWNVLALAFWLLPGLV